MLTGENAIAAESASKKKMDHPLKENGMAYNTLNGLHTDV